MMLQRNANEKDYRIKKMKRVFGTLYVNDELF